MIRLPDGTHITIDHILAMLRQSWHRGTPRPHHTTPGMTDTARAQRDAQARAERLDRTDVALGEHPAPYDLDIDQLLEEAPAAINDLDYLETWATRALSVLGLLTDGQLLDALCPWCDGRTPAAPAGGERTLRVRILEDGRPAIACEGQCEPPEADYGAEWRGHPAWPLEAEGAWLAGRIEHADQARQLAADQIARMQTSAVLHTQGRCPWCDGPVPLGRASCSKEHGFLAAQRSRRERRRRLAPACVDDPSVA